MIAMVSQAHGGSRRLGHKRMVGASERVEGTRKHEDETATPIENVLHASQSRSPCSCLEYGRVATAIA